MSVRDRSGFTLVEILIVTLLGAVVLAATYQTLVANQRTYTIQAAQIQGQQTIRAGMDVMFGELRELSATGGDLRSLGADSVTIRTMRAFALACDTATVASPQVTARRVGRWLTTGDSAFALIDGDPDRQSDDAWRSVRVTAVDTTATCGTGTEPAQVLTLEGLVAPDRILPGAPLRAFEQYTYGLMAYEGGRYLGRKTPTGTYQPVVGPLDSSASQPVAFTYLDENGSATADPDAVAQIQLTLRTRAPVRGAQGGLVKDSLTLRINTRN